MESEQIRILKIILIVSVILAVIGAIFYLIYSFSLFWQRFAFGITISLLSIILVLALATILYLWIRNFLLKKELNQCKNRLSQVNHELNKCESRLKQEDQE